MDTLRSRGVYGVVVASGELIDIDDRYYPSLRHLHPTELAWLNGMIAPESWNVPLKLALAGLGRRHHRYTVCGWEHRLFDTLTDCSLVLRRCLVLNCWINT